MRLVLVIGGILLTMISIPSYYYAPYFLTNTAHSFIGSMSAGNTLSGASMLRQMGYPPLHVVIPIFQYLLIGLSIMGISFAAYGSVAKKIPKPVAVKVVTGQLVEEADSTFQPKNVKSNMDSRTITPNDQASFNAVNDVLTKLEIELKGIKTGYEEHRQEIENEKKKLEQKERERMAKIIATGEVLIKEITLDNFEDRINYYMELKNKDTGQPIDLSLLAEKFDSMKKKLDCAGRNYLSSSEFDNFKKFLD